MSSVHEKFLMLCVSPSPTWAHDGIDNSVFAHVCHGVISLFEVTEKMLFDRIERDIC